MNWLDKLKIALLEQNDQKAYLLVTHLPNDLTSYSLEEKKQALELIEQTKQLLESQKYQIQIYMEQIKAARKFLEILD